LFSFGKFFFFKSINEKKNSIKSKVYFFNKKNITAKILQSISVFLKSQTKVKGKYGSVKMLQWRLQSGPRAYSGIVVLRSSNKIIAMLSCTAKNLWFQNKKFFLGEIGDAYTHKNHRRKGHMWRALQYCCEKYKLQKLNGLYSTPWENAESLPALKIKAGFSSPEKLRVLNRIFCLEPCEKIFPSFNYRSQIDSFFKKLVSIWLNLLHYFCWGNYLKICRQKDIPQNWDDIFWKKIRNKYDFVFERSKEYMYWRYFNSPQKYHLCTVVFLDREVGYFVYSIQRESVLLADFFLSRAEKIVFLHILKFCIKIGIEKKAKKIVFWSNSFAQHDRIAAAMGFLRGSAIMPIFFPSDFLQKNKRSKKLSWFFQMGDSDNV